MTDKPSLDAYLTRQAGSDMLRVAVAEVVASLAATAIHVSEAVSLGNLADIVEETRGYAVGGDEQKEVDVWADRQFREALKACPIAAFASEEADELEIWDASQPLCVAIDPVDGSGNLELNMPAGTIFSIMPTPDEFVRASAADRTLIWPAGTSQLAAGFVIYGPQTTVVLSLGESVDIFTLDRRRGQFRLSRPNVRLPDRDQPEYSINASNYRHWEEPVRAFIDECQAGADGPSGRDHNMRWHGALVADTFHALTRGGIYLYPADARIGYGQGRLRLIYEAYPMAFLMERAGGAGSNGRIRILDIRATSLHQRVPLILGASNKVAHLERLHNRPGLWPPTSAPLFANRGLFRV
ncbi:class 1 fructose-bisphosphatase [Labrys okinawensis]|uniref:Fructose-1,6-bisphosphatase class 1 n=1 Tax=Labrys okinawensis TaxID=346911 RepID=A0A2S9Q6K0_9HYPH|nr:class 1 fructose-bisphosphatase [Labrys okinawensis]PRH84988.1 class 1 fructose-bisphosphatase [Labrys okinawensis]